MRSAGITSSPWASAPKRAHTMMKILFDTGKKNHRKARGDAHKKGNIIMLPDKISLPLIYTELDELMDKQGHRGDGGPWRPRMYRDVHEAAQGGESCGEEVIYGHCNVAGSPQVLRSKMGMRFIHNWQSLGYVWSVGAGSTWIMSSSGMWGRTSRTLLAMASSSGEPSAAEGGGFLSLSPAELLRFLRAMGGGGTDGEGAGHMFQLESSRAPWAYVSPTDARCLIISWTLSSPVDLPPDVLASSAAGPGLLGPHAESMPDPLQRRLEKEHEVDSLTQMRSRYRF